MRRCWFTSALSRRGGQTARLGIAEEDLDGLVDGWHLGGLDLFARNRRVFVFAGEEFGLLPGFGLCRDTEPVLTTRKGSVEPLGATATTIGGIVFLWAIGMVTRIDGEHDASYSSTKNWLVQFRYSLRNCRIFRSLNDEYKVFSCGGGGGSRTRVRNCCQPGVFMLCPVPFGFIAGTQNGQDAPETSPMISRKQHGPSRSRQPTV